MTQKAEDLMMQAPSFVSEKQLKELNIRLAPQVAADLKAKSVDGAVDPAAG